MNKDGELDFEEFLVGIRVIWFNKLYSKGKLNPRRQALVDKAFLKFDKDGNGVINAADLKYLHHC